MTDIATLFRECWDEEIEKRREQSPSYSVDQYVVTGRAPAQYGGKRNQEWWLDHGPGMVERWIEWQERQEWTLWDVNGQPAIELSCNFTLPGDIPVVTYIDRVFVTKTGEQVIVDLKTGRSPETPEQLGVYATAIEAVHGVRPTWGVFWDAQKGEHSQFHLLDMYTPEYLARVFEEAIAGINAGAFMARPANGCRNWCSVARACAAVGGSEASTYDPLLRV